MLLGVSLEAEPFSVGLTSRAYWANTAVTQIPKDNMTHFNGADFSIGAYFKYKSSVDGVFYALETGVRGERLYFNVNETVSTSKVNQFAFANVQLGFAYEFVELVLGMNMLYNYASDFIIKGGALDFRPNYQLNFLVSDFTLFAGVEHSVFSKDYDFREEGKILEVSRLSFFTGVSYELF